MGGSVRVSQHPAWQPLFNTPFQHQHRPKRLIWTGLTHLFMSGGSCHGESCEGLTKTPHGRATLYSDLILKPSTLPTYCHASYYDSLSYMYQTGGPALWGLREDLTITLQGRGTWQLDISACVFVYNINEYCIVWFLCPSALWAGGVLSSRSGRRVGSRAARWAAARLAEPISL